jgi:predicted RNase H-like nuclease (RuvC/YqgF family)
MSEDNNKSTGSTSVAIFRCKYEEDGRAYPCQSTVPKDGMRCRCHTPEALEVARDRAIDGVTARIIATNEEVRAAREEYRQIYSQLSALELQRHRLQYDLNGLQHEKQRVQREIDDLNAEVNARQWQEKSAAMQARAADLLMSSAPNDADRELASSLIEAARELRISHGGAATPYQPERGYRTKRTATKRNGKAGTLDPAYLADDE